MLYRSIQNLKTINKSKLVVESAPSWTWARIHEALPEVMGRVMIVSNNGKRLFSYSSTRSREVRTHYYRYTDTSFRPQISSDPAYVTCPGSWARTVALSLKVHTPGTHRTCHPPSSTLIIKHAWRDSSIRFWYYLKDWYQQSNPLPQAARKHEKSPQKIQQITLNTYVKPEINTVNTTQIEIASSGAEVTAWHGHPVIHKPTCSVTSLWHDWKAYLFRHRYTVFERDPLGWKMCFLVFKSGYRNLYLWRKRQVRYESHIS